MARLRFDNVAGTLTTDLAAGATTLTSANLSRMGRVAAPDYAAITILDANGDYEIVYVTSHTADSPTATISRAQEGTSDIAHDAGATWNHGDTAQDFAELGTQVVVTADREPDDWIDSHVSLAVDYKASLVADGEIHDAQMIYVRPSLDATAARLVGLRISAAPTGANPPDEQTAVWLHWDAAAGLTTPLAIGMYAHVGVIGGVITDARSFVADLAVGGAFGGGQIVKATGFYLADGGNAADDPWAFQTGAYKSQHMGALAVGGTTIDTAPNDDASIDLQATDKALILNRLTTTQRNALTPVEGMTVYNTTTDQLEAYVDSAWRHVVDAGGTTFTGTVTLSDGSPAASQAYATALSTGIVWKSAVACAATSNVSLTGEQTIDGVLTSTSRVLLTGQTAPAENGVYVTAAGAWARATDNDQTGEFVGAWVPVSAGTSNSGIWRCTNTVAPTVGSTSIGFEKLPIATVTADGSSIVATGSVLSRGALTGDVTASQGSNATTVVKVRGTTWEASAPALGEIPVYDGSSITWQPRRNGNEIHLGDERWGLYLDGTNASSNDTAMDAVLAAAGEGDTIVLPPGANIAVTRPIFFDQQCLSVVTEGAPRQTHNMSSHTTAKFTAAAAMPWVATFEGPPERGNEAADDGNKTFQFCRGVSFDAAGLCTRGVVLVNGRETQFREVSVHGPVAGTGRFSVAEDGSGMFPMFSIGQDTTSITGWTRSGNTLTKTSHGLTDLELVNVVTLNGLGGVTAGYDYYVIRVDADTISLATTRANARADTAITLSGATSTAILARANNAQDCNVVSSRAMGGIGTLGSTTYPAYTTGFWIKDAADCLLEDTKAVRCDVNFWVTAATCGIVNCHPFSGAVADTISSGVTTYGHGFAHIVISGGGHRIVGNYLDNAPGYDSTDGSGAWIFLNCDDAYVTDMTIANNVFNNGAGGGDLNPAIRVKGAVGRLVNGLTITGNAFHAKCDQINHSNGASSNLQAGDITCNTTTNVFTTSGAHGLRDGQPIVFSAVTSASGVTANTVYFVDWQSTTTFKISTTRDGTSTVDVTATDSTWAAEGYRTGIFKGLLSAENWSNMKSVTFTGNSARWVWDPYYDSTTGLGYTDPVRVFINEASPSAIVWPTTYGNNTYDIGNDILMTSSANSRNYIDQAPMTLTAVRTSDGTAVNNSTTHVNDSVLSVPVAANTSYILEGFVAFSADPSADISLGWTMPTGASITWGPFGPKTSIAADSSQWLARVSTGNYDVGAEGTATLDGCNPRGLVTIGSTAGTFQLKMAQATAHASDAKIRAGSWIKLTPVASRLIQRA